MRNVAVLDEPTTVEGDLTMLARTTTRMGMLAFALGVALGACDYGAFSCSEHEECIDGDRIGLCQLDGWCSFSDMTCQSLQRYGELSGAEVAGECVPLPLDIPEYPGGADETLGGEEDDDSAGSGEPEFIHDDGTTEGGTDDSGGVPMDDCSDDPALALCLRFESVDGSTVYDDADPSVHGDLMGDASIGAGHHGDALSLPGVDGRLALGGAIDPVGSFSVDAWVWLADTSPAWAGIVDKWEADQGYWLGGANEPGGLSFWVNGTNVSVSTVPTEQWIHVVATFEVESGAMSLYVDGELVALGQHSGHANSMGKPLVMGHSVQDNAALQGRIDSVRIWNRLLELDEL